MTAQIHWTDAALKAGGCGVSVHAPGYTIASEWFRSVRDFDLWVMLDGTAEIRIDESDWLPLGPGSCLWLTPTREYEFRVTGDKKLAMTYVHFDFYTPDDQRILPANVEVEPTLCHTSDPRFFETGLRRIMLLSYLMREEGGERAGLVERQMSHLLRALLYEYALHCREGDPLSGGLKARHQGVVARAVSWIHEHPEANHTMEELAARFGYNARYFCRIFIAHTGRTPRQMMIQAKIAQARQLLATSAMNVGEIAESLGYTNIYYFSRQFSKETGQSPTEYRVLGQKVQKRQM